MSDAELTEMQRRAPHTDLWDEDDRNDLFARINAARRVRGLQPMHYEPPAWYSERVLS